MSTRSAESKKPSKSLHYGLWVVQVLLALTFVSAGGMKLAMPLEELAANGIAFAGRSSFAFVKFTGLVEVLGGVGVIAPAALRILPMLTPAAAVGLVVTMLAATAEHLIAGEAAAIAAPIILGLMAAFVAYGRGLASPIESR